MLTKFTGDKSVRCNIHASVEDKHGNIFLFTGDSVFGHKLKPAEHESPTNTRARRRWGVQRYRNRSATPTQPTLEWTHFMFNSRFTYPKKNVLVGVVAGYTCHRRSSNNRPTVTRTCRRRSNNNHPTAASTIRSTAEAMISSCTTTTNHPSTMRHRKCNSRRRRPDSGREIKRTSSLVGVQYSEHSPTLRHGPAIRAARNPLHSRNTY